MSEKIKGLTDKRKRKNIQTADAVWMVLIGLLVQCRSFHQLFQEKSYRKRLKHCVSCKIPKTDAICKILKELEETGLKKVFDHIVFKIRENKTFRGGTIDGLVVAGIDGVELFSSYAKHCTDCLKREHSNGEIEYFHRSVVCMSVGSSPHVILGQEMLKPRDGSGKDEGEQTGGRRLIEELHRTFHHFADVIVGDALYMNAPFIQTVLKCGMDVVIRAKDEKRLIVQDALGLFRQSGVTEEYEVGKLHVEVWDAKDLQMEGVNRGVRFIQFVETRKEQEKKGKQKAKKERVMKIWVVTTLGCSAETIRKIMHRRWDIEENGFHQLKTYYHANHCFCHESMENIFLLNLMAFNLREMYLYMHLRGFKKSKRTRIGATKEWEDSLLFEDCRAVVDSDWKQKATVNSS